MKPKVKHILLKDLEQLLASKEYQQWETVPITRHRALSYQQNPHASPKDPVLFLAFHQENLIAFRSVFAGKTGTIKFGWCSGAWTHPDFRGQGISIQLLNEAYQAWNGKLAFTNYAPSAEKLILRSGLFQPVHQFEGIRAYLFPHSKLLFRDKNPGMPLLSILSIFDSALMRMAQRRIKKYIPGPTHHSFLIEEGGPDHACLKLYEQRECSSLFGRDKKELEWIFSNPWVLRDKKHFEPRYPFSSADPTFRYYTVKLYLKQELTGFLILSERRSKLKTLLICTPPEAFEDVAVFLRNLAVSQQVAHLTVYKKEIATRMFQRKFPFLRLKNYGQKIYSTFTLPKSGNFMVQDGDGDSIFS